MSRDSFDTIYNYKYFKQSVPFQTGINRIRDMIGKILKFDPETVLDVGCGIGVLVRHLRHLGIDAHGVDLAKTLKERWWEDKSYFHYGRANKLPFLDKQFNMVFSSDFLEHVPEEDIDKVVAEMNRVGKVVLARIAYGDKLTEKQKTIHVTNKSKEWWHKKLYKKVWII